MNSTDMKSQLFDNCRRPCFNLKIFLCRIVMPMTRFFFTCIERERAWTVKFETVLWIIIKAFSYCKAFRICCFWSSYVELKMFLYRYFELAVSNCKCFVSVLCVYCNFLKYLSWSFEPFSADYYSLFSVVLLHQHVI